MLISLLEADSQDLRTDYTVCIIGTGIAGYEVARRLAAHPHCRILLLESGDVRFNAFYQQLNQQLESAKQTRVSKEGAGSFPDTASRSRQLGGTLNIWSGKWKPMEPYDFQPKAWHKHLRWPIAFDDLLPYYRTVIADYQLTELAPDERLPAPANPFLKATPYHQQDPAESIGNRLRELSKRENVTILYQATVSELLLEETGRIRGVQIRRMDGRTNQAFAQVFVLATGGIENARILLNTPGLAHQLPALGKYYMDHPKGELATMSAVPKPLQPTDPSAFPERRCFWGLATPLLEEFHLPNHSFAIGFAPATTGKNSLPSLYRQSKRKVRQVANALLGRNQLPVNFFLEQLPSAASYVALSRECDALGIPKAVLHWSFASEEQEKLLLYLHVLTQNLQTAYGCTLQYPEQTLSMDQTLDASHHMGTTRMGTHRADSVVDSHARVHGIANLFVAGSSVFSTAGNANPTLTIAALAARLGDHLCQKIT